MPDRPKSTAPPEPPNAYDDVVRRTWATRFDNPRVPKVLETIGRILMDSHQEGGSWGTTHDLGVVRCGLAAVADDLESLAHFLSTEVADAPTTYSVTKTETALCHRATGWRDALLVVAEEIREAVGAQAPE